MPRRDEPRTTVPAGAVGLAGEFSGVYPRSSPGGWQLIGSTDAALWDLDRDPPALLQPGAGAVRAAHDRAWHSQCIGSQGTCAASEVLARARGRAVGPLALVEDLGRPGLGASGVGRSGAADRAALRLANRLVANPEGAAAVEVRARRARRAGDRRC